MLGTSWPDVALELVQVIPPTIAALAAVLIGVHNKRVADDTHRIANETNTVVNDRLHGAPTMSQDVKELRDRSDRDAARHVDEGQVVAGVAEDVDVLLERSDEGEVRRSTGLPPEGGHTKEA